MENEEREERTKSVTDDLARLKLNAAEPARQKRREAAMEALDQENASIDSQIAVREAELAELTAGL